MLSCSGCTSSGGCDRMNGELILAIETSCDETSAAVVKCGRTVLSNVIATQIDLHKEYGGVVPEIASRLHVEMVLPVVDKALKEAGVSLSDIDAFAATAGPGLVGALLVGVTTAKGFSYATGKPLIGVHHIEGHIMANLIEHPELKPPFMCLVVSGGHSHIIRVEDDTTYTILGRTRDDAAGEAFDKIARVMGLGYPGGPAIDKTAKQGNPQAFRFPRVSFANAPYDFSFSGLKTAVINTVHQFEQRGEQLPISDICASFQQAVVDVLVDKTVAAAINYKEPVIALAGGVASNRLLRESLTQSANLHGIKVVYPSPILCTDNAAMIGCAAWYRHQAGHHASLALNANPSMVIGQRVV